MNQTMDITFGIMNVSALPLRSSNCRSLLAAFCIHANGTIKSTVTSDIIFRLARVSLGDA